MSSQSHPRSYSDVESMPPTGAYDTDSSSENTPSPPPVVRTAVRVISCDPARRTARTRLTARKTTGLPRKVVLPPRQPTPPLEDEDISSAAGSSRAPGEYVLASEYTEFKESVNARIQLYRESWCMQEMLNADVAGDIDLINQDLMTSRDLVIAAREDAHAARVQGRAWAMIAILTIVMCTLVHVLY